MNNAKKIMKTKFEICNKDLKFRGSIKENEYDHKVKSWAWRGVETYQLLRREISWKR